MTYIKFNTTVESKAKDTSTIPVNDGQFLILTDTQKLMYDNGDKRIVLGDIIELETESERSALLTPLNKFYFIKNTGVLWRYNSGSWIRWPILSSVCVECMLSADGWSDGMQTIEVAGLQSSHNGSVSMSQSINSEQFSALAAGNIVVSGQADNLLTFTVFGVVPQIDIPIAVTLLE